ncbi:coiled-coil domain-containing protein 78-like isoform X2 [Ptychodera flava]|uniref:coiled-coil domain-containing protein 78-like isoform X2 n=1 Tax=Ptychodera flava TaxID=63121 RepID=UPI00396A15D2
MNIETVARIRPSVRGEGPHNVNITGHHRIVGQESGHGHSYQMIFKQDSSNFDVYRKSVEPMLNIFLTGYNCSILSVGESYSGKSYTLTGESTNKAGIVPIFLDALFNKLDDGRRADEAYMYDERLKIQRGQVTMSMIEVYNESIRDLLTLPSSKNPLPLKNSPQEGVHAKNAFKTPIKSASDATALFRQGWGKRIIAQTDHGSAHCYASTIITIELTARHGENPHPNISKFTFIDTPAAEKLAEDSQQIRLREGPTLSRPILAFGQLVANLANAPNPERVISYRESKFTSLLHDIMGGNCKTTVIVHFRPQPDPHTLSVILRLSSQLSLIRNFPVLNDSLCQGLITQYRAKIVSLEDMLGLGVSAGTVKATVGEIQNDHKLLAMENIQLKDKNERLLSKLEALQSKFGDIAEAKTNLSSKLIMSEEEKLKVSKTLVDLQLENNKIKEEAEQARFELTNRILSLENELMELGIEKDKLGKKYRDVKERLDDMERDRKELADEYVSLKSNYVALSKEHERELAKNEELGIELLNLVNARATLLKQQENLERAHGTYSQANNELERIRAIVSRLTTKRLKADDLLTSEKERLEIEKRLFGTSQRYGREIDKLRNQYDEDQERLESKLISLGKELQDARKMARASQHRVAEQSTELIRVGSKCRELETENNKLQIQLKELNEEYRSRLVKYVEDIADFVDSGSGMPPGAEEPVSSSKMTKYVEDMMRELKRSHRLREEQLSNAARAFKAQAQKVGKRHEELLVAYRLLRQQIEGQRYTDIDLGMDEYDLRLTDTELESENRREINKLKEELAHIRAVGHDAIKKSVSFDDDANWGSLRKQLREFTLNTQQELEAERAALLTRCTMAEESLAECQEYIDKHLVRYKQEIERLRRMLGMDPHDGEYIPDSYRAAKGRRKHKRY